MSFNSKMTAIADKIRSILGISGTMGLDAMATNLGTVQNSVDSQADIIVQIETALEGKSAGSSGGSGATIKTATTVLDSGARTISFTGLDAEPKMFVIIPIGELTLSSIRYVTGVVYDGSLTHGRYGYHTTSSGKSYYSSSYFTWTYNNGTLTVNTSSSNNGGNFAGTYDYRLVYVY